jgi:nitrogen fixation NifU-like protein
MSALDDLYQEIILDHYRSPRHRAAALEPHDVHVHHANPLCGDELDLRIRVRDRRIDALAYDGEGCAISMASASTMSEVVTGRTLDDAEDLAEAFRLMIHGEGIKRQEDMGDGVAFQGIAKSPARVKCALLGWMALLDALRTYGGGERSNRVTYDSKGFDE